MSTHELRLSIVIRSFMPINLGLTYSREAFKDAARALSPQRFDEVIQRLWSSCQKSNSQVSIARQDASNAFRTLAMDKRLKESILPAPVVGPAPIKIAKPLGAISMMLL